MIIRILMFIAWVLLSISVYKVIDNFGEINTMKLKVIVSIVLFAGYCLSTYVCYIIIFDKR